jgi:signal transduction histidine kinase
VICTAYLYIHTAEGGTWSFWSSPSLIRIPFLFSVAACYGYLVDRTRRERQRAVEADRIKMEFLGTISHEFRTPLNVILGYVDLLLDRTFGPLSQEEEEALRKVRSAGGNLYDFLGRLMDVSRIVSRIHQGARRSSNPNSS